MADLSRAESSEEKTKLMLDKIEKLIIDGNKGIIDRVDKKLDETKQELQQEMRGMEERLAKDIGVVKHDVKDLKFQAKTLDTSIGAVHYDVKELDKKVDAHLKVPHAV